MLNDNALLNAATAVARRVAKLSDNKMHENKTNGVLIAAQIAPEKISGIQSIIETGFDEALKSDPFTLGVAKLVFLRAMSDSLSIFYGAASADPTMKDAIAKVYQSVEDLETLHKDDSFLRNIEPLHNNFLSGRKAIEGIKKKLADSVAINVVPMASAKAWYAAMVRSAGLVHPNSQNVSEAQAEIIKTCQIEGHPITVSSSPLSAMSSLRRTVAAIKKAKTLISDIDKELFSSFNDVSDSVKIASAGLGNTKKVLTWLEFIARLEGAGIITDGLIDHASISAFQTHEHFLLDFSNIEEEMFSHNTASAIEDAIEKTAKRTKDIGILANEHHERALMLHILGLAGTGVQHKPSSTDHRVQLRIPGLVGVEYHYLSGVIKRMMEKGWKAFSPAKITLEFPAKLAAMAGGKAYVDAKRVRKDIADAVFADLRKITDAVNTASSNGESFSGKEFVDQVQKDHIGYDTNHLCADDDVHYTCDVSVESFVAGVPVTISSTRPVGESMVPNRVSGSFAEAALLRDKYNLNAVATSASTTVVGALFNGALLYTDMPFTSFDLGWSVGKMFSRLAADMKRGFLRSGGRKASSLKASEMFPEAKFTPLTDYNVQTYETSKGDIPVVGGLARLNRETKTIGNVFNSFSFGVLSSVGYDLTPDYVRAQNDALHIIFDFIADEYSAHPITVVKPEAVKLSLDVKNRTYIKRIAELTDFTDVDIDYALLMSVVGSPLLRDIMGGVIEPSDFARSERMNVSIHKNMLSIIRIVAETSIERIAGAYDLSMLVMAESLLAGSPTVSDRAFLRDAIKRGPVMSIFKSLADLTQIIPKEQAFIKPVLLTILLRELRVAIAAKTLTDQGA